MYAYNGPSHNNYMTNDPLPIALDPWKEKWLCKGSYLHPTFFYILHTSFLELYTISPSSSPCPKAIATTRYYSSPKREFAKHSRLPPNRNFDRSQTMKQNQLPLATKHDDETHNPESSKKSMCLAITIAIAITAQHILQSKMQHCYLKLGDLNLLNLKWSTKKRKICSM